ncbi:MAG: fibrobacter succinogenes major paralogous domain-containing protein [Mediterranea sp.]|jgi:hypothetical protein|nr:fibrobacter succinogenes major paralogous domain-containing protein [Mediterranea sp.]
MRKSVLQSISEELPETSLMIHRFEVPQNTLYYPVDFSVKVNFMAYYPYSSGATSGTVDLDKLVQGASGAITVGDDIGEIIPCIVSEDADFIIEAADETKGTVGYTIKNPSVFIANNASPFDWYYGDTRDDTLWGHNTVKSFYDPCLSGWRVPIHSDGTEAISPWKGFVETGTTTPANLNGVWSAGYSWGDNAQYPAVEYRHRESGTLYYPGTLGYYWSASPISDNASSLYFNNGNVYVANTNYRANGFSIRCVRE